MVVSDPPPAIPMAVAAKAPASAPALGESESTVVDDPDGLDIGGLTTMPGAPEPEPELVAAM